MEKQQKEISESERPSFLRKIIVRLWSKFEWITVENGQVNRRKKVYGAITNIQKSHVAEEILELKMARS